MKPVSLYLVRHGAVISIRGKAYIGQVEAPLDEAGVEQAWALRRYLEPVVFHSVVASDLSRSLRTARIIAGKHARVESWAELREIDLGSWDGLSFSEIQSRFPEDFEARGRDLEHWRPPGGESFADLRGRVLPALRRVLDAARGNVLVVGHAGVNRVILCEALGIPVSNLFNIAQDYGCLNILEHNKAQVRLRLLNFVPFTLTESQPAASVTRASRHSAWEGDHVSHLS
jgi:alpha-ribazole phosphatase